MPTICSERTTPGPVRDIPRAPGCLVAIGYGLAIACLVCDATVGQPRESAAPLFVADYALTVGPVATEIAGLSGAWYDEATRTLWAVPDDAERPRLVAFDLAPGAPPRPALRQVVPLRVAGQSRPLKMEGVAPAGDGAFFVASEGDPSDPDAPLAGVYRCAVSGTCETAFALPPYYMSANTDDGLRGGRGFEGLSVSPNSSMLFAAVESSLKQDGPEATADAGPLTRILAINLSAPDAEPREYAYRVDAPTRFPGRSGVTEILALDDMTLLVAEYGGYADPATGRAGGATRYYRVRLDSGAEVTGQAAIDPGRQTTLEKELVVDLAGMKPLMRPELRQVVSVAGITFGPRLADGTRSLLLLNSFQDEPGMGFVQLQWPD